MKKKLRFSMIVLLGILLVLSGGIIQALAAQYSLIVDEYGTGYYKDLGSSNPQWNIWNGAVVADPTGTGLNVLCYVADRASNFTGYHDLLIRDSTGAPSDMLRWWNPPSAPLYTMIIFYSGDTSGGAPADTGLPPTTSWNLFDTIYEDSNGVFHYTFPGNGNQFTGYSDGRAPVPSVPEPSTMLLLGLGLIGLAGARRKFKN